MTGLLRRQRLFLAALLAVASCGGTINSSGADAGAGTTGGGGTAGTGGGGAAGTGSGGTDGLAMCSLVIGGSSLIVQTPDGLPQTLAATSMTVTSVDNCTLSECNDGFRVQLTAPDGRTWDLFAALPDMPFDLIKVGDVLELRIDVTETSNSINTVRRQTTRVSRGGNLLMFSSDHPADLASEGIVGGSNGIASCRLNTCFVLYGGAVQIGTETVSMAPGQSAQVGPYRVTAGGIRAMGPCDSQDTDFVSGFRTP